MKKYRVWFQYEVEAVDSARAILTVFDHIAKRDGGTYPVVRMSNAAIEEVEDE